MMRLRKYFLTIGSRLAVIALTALFGILSARILGPEAKGAYSIVTLLPAAVSTVAMLAGPQYVILDVNQFSGVTRRARSLLRLSHFAAMGGAVGAVFIYAAIEQDAAFLHMSLLFFLVWSGAASLIITEYVAAFFQANQKFALLAAIRVLQVLLPGLAMLGGAIQFGLSGAIGGFFAGSICAGILGWNAWRFFSYTQAVSPREAAISWPYVASTSVSIVLLFLAYRADVLVLGSLSSASQVGLYTAAVALAELALVGSLSVIVIKTPSYVGTSNIRLKDMVLVVVTAVAVSLLLFISADLIVPLLFGEDFIGAIRAVKILIPGVVMLAIFRFLTAVELIQQHKYGVLVSCILMISADFALLICLAPSMGAVGGAIAASTSYLLGLIYLGFHRLIRDRGRSNKYAAQGRVALARNA